MRLLALARPLMLVVLLGIAPAVPAAADSAAALARAQGMIGRGDWPAATAEAATGGAVVADLVEWQRLRDGQGTLTEYEDFLRRRTDWPGLALLRQKGEVAAARSTTPERVIAWFDAQAPRTGAGAVALVQAFQAAGRGAEAQAEARRAWATLSFSAAEETALLALVPDLPAEAHEARLDHLLWADRRAEAERMLPRVSPGWQALAKARTMLRRDTEGITAAIAAVPKALADDPGLAHDRFVWRMRKDRTDEAAALILERSRDAASLGRPGEWANRRAGLARELMRAGKAETAYRVAAGHHLTEGADFADLEFLAGFIALRKLGRAEAALEHFRHLQTGVATPISLSRSLYWQGRALEAMGSGEAARSAYELAAQHQTAFYGQLAAEKLGVALDPALLAQDRAGWREAGFVRSSVTEAALIWLQAGDRAQAKRFFLHLAEGLDARGLAQLAAMAQDLGEPHIGVMIAKQAAERGIILPDAYFPVVAMVPDGLAVSRALALSIARRESEFDPAARSQAGARGLMQVMPATGKLMAEKLGQPFDLDKLSGDPAYNAQMGSAYLAQLVQEFGPSVALVASGYNAGPGRPRRWITEFGDPRLPQVDAVDWVETIPFTETRTYVMRVVESLVIYRAKLRGNPGPVRPTAELKG